MKLKFLFKMIFCALLILFNPAIAKPTNDCPPVSMIMENAQFFHAARDKYEFWELTSKVFEYDNKNFRIFFSFMLPTARTSHDAISQGQKYFQAYVQLKGKPMEVDDNGFITCLYAPGDDGYVVKAYTP